jgi:hypothetical protein
MSETKIKWELFIARGVLPIRGTLTVEGDAPNEYIDEIVEDAVHETIANRITWEKETVKK